MAGYVCGRIGFALLTMLALLLALFCIAVAIAAMSHPQWISYFVNESQVATLYKDKTLRGFSRYRGMFLECPYEPSVALQAMMDSGLQENPGCVKLDMGRLNVGENNYWYFVHMRQTHVAMFSIGLFLVVVATLITIGAILMYICSRHGSSAYRGISFMAGFFFLLGGFSFLTSFLVFHVDLEEEAFYTSANIPGTVSMWETPILRFTRMTFTVGYGLAWAACISAFICGMFLWFAYCLNASTEKLRTEVLPPKTGPSDPVTGGQTNSAFVQGSDYLIVKDAVLGGNRNDASYYDGFYGRASNKAPDQESHYSSKNIYRIY